MTSEMKRFNPKDIETKWQKYWDENQTYKADLTSDKPKYIAMSMFNYPSGAGIHIGHAMNYTISDVMARYKRQQGYESYHPVGWDAFGLPAENFAIKSGVSPQASMAKIIPDYHVQYKAMGWSNDWSKEIATHDPLYYKWTQWIFAQMYKQGLAYQDARMQWWCTKCQTVLSNEQVIDGKCWRHDGSDDPVVEKKEVKQWFFKITEYADELLEATDALDWSEAVKTAQKNWIGKSKGADIDFALAKTEQGTMSSEQEKITVFTTRPDTIFGATFLVLAPEHELVGTLTAESEKSRVESYVKEAAKKTEVERQASKEKTGVFTGAYAVNPASGDEIPIWIADYVLVGYGTGAIMAVPAHDERDNEFAKKFDLPIQQVIASYEEFSGATAPKNDVETITRKTIDAIITNKDGQYLLEIEDDHVHFVGGGVDAEDPDDEAAVRREVLEETGYSNIESIAPVTPIVAGKQYRHTKNKNQQGYTTFYEVILADDKKVPSEADDGKHEIRWVNKDEVEALLTWSWHKDGWLHYLNAGDATMYLEEGVLVNSGEYDFMPSSDAREKIVADLTAKGVAQEKIQFKIRDWSVSRQRYWGAPIPIINCEKCGPQLIADDQLPVVLPELEDFQPSGDGRSALARATDWLVVHCPKCGGKAERETDTLDTYICSSWYFLRYFDGQNKNEIFDSNVANKWMPIDFYNGGDHATAHMIYARFVTRFLHTLGLVDDPEPFKRFLFNGKVKASDGSAFSKSKGNGVDPLEIISQGYGADALRTYLMFAAPLDLDSRWDPQGVPGSYRFLNRVWNLVQENLAVHSENNQSQVGLLRAIHPAIKKVTADLEDQKYNTAIAAMMKATNDLYDIKAKSGFTDKEKWQFALESLVQLIAPFAPHTAEELWHDLGHEDSVQRDHWPEWDEQYLASDYLTIAVQVNGKMRATIEVSADATEENVLAAAQTQPKVAGYLEGQPIRKSIYVPKKLVNFVI